MDSNPICHPSPTKKMKCSFLDYIQLLMISRAGQWTEIPFATPLQPKKWNVCFWIMFNFWWSAGLVNGLEPHLPPLSSQKNEMLVFGLCSTSDDQLGWSMDSKPICNPSQPKKWNAHFWIMFNFWWLARQAGPTKKMKCSFLDYVQLIDLMINQAGRRTPTPSATSFQPKKWNAHFCIMFKFWWSAELVDRLEPHLPPLSNQKNEMLVFVLRYTSDDQPGWSMDSKPIHHPLKPKKWNLNFCSTSDYVQLLMIGIGGWSINSELHPCSTPLQPKNEMLIFGLLSISGDQPGWSMDSNPIHSPLSSQKMKCSFLDYVQLLMISCNLFPTKKMKCWSKDSNPICNLFPMPKKWNAHFCITFNFWLAGLVNKLELPGWSMDSMDSNPIQPHLSPLSNQKNEMLVLVLWFNFWWSAGLVNGLKPHLPPLSSQKNDMLIFVLHSSSDDWLGWSMDLNPICNLSPAKKVKCSFLDYVQLLMMAWAGQWTQTHLPPLSRHKMKCSFLDYV